MYFIIYILVLEKKERKGLYLNNRSEFLTT